MKTNEGTLDRIVRVVVGAGILSMAFVGPHTPFAYVGIIPIVTGIAGFCPAYTIFGFNTCSMKKS